MQTSRTVNPPGLAVAVIGGGAAGFFAAIAAAEADPSAQVRLFESTPAVLAKVRISGGGRCNVTHACFEPRELVRRYPRGSRELMGPFHRFGPPQTIAWFAARGVTLKTEADGRMFPDTDDSSTIVQCLSAEASRLRVEVRIRCGIQAIERSGPARADPSSPEHFWLTLSDGTTWRADRIILATGGARSGGGVSLAAALGHTVEPPVPSLFTFHIEDERLKGLEGLSVPDAEASVAALRLSQRGPALVTHWGLSGPAILKLSAWGARELAGLDYRFPLHLSWVGGLTREEAVRGLAVIRAESPRRQLNNVHPWNLPSRLWERLVRSAGLSATATWTNTGNAALEAIAAQVVRAEYAVQGKSLNKEEFVTCGGVRLREVDFRRMESRVCPGLFLAGEVLDIDGITGGFNFQAAWTTGWIAGRAAVGAEDRPSSESADPAPAK